jgi:PAS domain S-box-containing protein
MFSSSLDEMSAPRSCEAPLRAVESRYRRVFETAQDGILLLNAETAQIEDANPYLVNLLGYAHADLLGKRLWEVGPFADVGHIQAMFLELQTKGYIRYENVTVATAAGDKVDVDLTGNIYDCEGSKVVQCNVRDVSGRRIIEKKLERHTRLYAALSQCNKAIVHSTTPEELFSQVCHAAVRFGEMKMAWIGLVDPNTKMVHPVASFGEGAEYLSPLKLSVDRNSLHGGGPTCIALLSGKPYWCQDLPGDPAAAAWRDLIERAGWASLASLPLRKNSEVIGAFILYCSETDAFDHLARDLLIEMAVDISFALDAFEREHRRGLMEARLREAEKDVLRYVEDLKAALNGTIDVVETVCELRDPYTSGHERRVAQIAVAIAAELGLDDHRQEGLRAAGNLHDVGKIMIPAEILAKPSKLSPIEYALVQGHVRAGYEVLKNVKFPWPVAQVVLQHHERMDGSGYPQGLKGEDILIEARIIAVADVVEAMSSHRPYRPGLSIEAGLGEIERYRGVKYDPVVVDACLKLFRDKGYTLPGQPDFS